MTSFAHQLAQQHFDVVDGNLSIDGISVRSLADSYGTPLYVYSANRIRELLDGLKQATLGTFDIYFSIKANPNPSVIRVLCDAGAGAEIASGAEYEAARQAGVSPDRIIFAGPGKGSEELAHVVDRGIGEIHLESLDELDRLIKVMKKTDRSVNVSLRINPTAEVQGGSMRMGGRPSQFGFDEELLSAIVAKCKAAGKLNIAGLHLYAGTQILDAKTLVNQWAHAIKIAEQLAHEIGGPLQTIDLGGGLGIPYLPGDGALDLNTIQDATASLTKEIANSPMLDAARIIIEPGRYLCGPAGMYVSEVLGVKMSKGERFAVTNGGMHHHLAASGNLGQIIKKDYPLLLANRMDEDYGEQVTVVGPLCTPLDTYGRKTKLPIPESGDLIAVLQSGAYGLTASPVGFLSQPMPAEILVDDGQVKVIRPRGTFQDPFTRPVPA